MTPEEFENLVSETGFETAIKKATGRPTIYFTLRRNIPEYMWSGLIYYILWGIQPGSFLSAVLQGNLRAAAMYADNVNKGLLYEYVYFLYNEAPTGSWGSDAAFAQWHGIYPRSPE